MSIGTNKKLSSNSEMVIIAHRIERAANRLVRFTDQSVGYMVKKESFSILRQAFKFWIMAISGKYKKAGK
jgi:hypothetical protein